MLLCRSMCKIEKKSCFSILFRMDKLASFVSESCIVHLYNDGHFFLSYTGKSTPGGRGDTPGGRGDTPGGRGDTFSGRGHYYFKKLSGYHFSHIAVLHTSSDFYYLIPSKDSRKYSMCLVPMTEKSRDYIGAPRYLKSVQPSPQKSDGVWMEVD